jgi:uncharacterized Fe-S cluster-containing radical SAM superfamily protein
MIDTLRVLVSWKCNLHCSYCCNDIPEFRKDIKEVRFEDIDWEKYKNVCISGGEPLMFLDLTRRVALAASRSFKILYTNGILLDKGTARQLGWWGINAVNVGLHYPESYDILIHRVLEATAGNPYLVRFHLNEMAAGRTADIWPGVEFRYWRMNDCARDNEERIVLRLERKDVMG